MQQQIRWGNIKNYHEFRTLKVELSFRGVLDLTLIVLQLMIVIGASVSFLLGSVLNWRKLALAGML